MSPRPSNLAEPELDLAAERRALDRLRRRWHHPRYVAPDPLEFVRAAADPEDREVVALIASALAYGNVTAMRRAIAAVLAALGPDPARRLARRGPAPLRRDFAGFRYRVTPGAQLAGLLAGAARVRADRGSLGAALREADEPAAPTVLPGLAGLVAAIRAASPEPLDHLLPAPSDGSACKRLALMLRWMIRRDAVDPGGWTGVAPARLIMPIDVHVFRAARARGWTRRRTPNLAAALEVTALLRRLRPDDPLRWDFALTRPGIRREAPGAESVGRSGPGTRRS